MRFFLRLRKDLAMISFRFNKFLFSINTSKIVEEKTLFNLTPPHRAGS